MQEKNIKIIIIVLLIILLSMIYLIFDSYTRDKNIIKNTESNEIKKWNINKYAEYYELYIDDNNKEDGSNVYLLDKNNNLIYTFKNYNKENHLYVALGDISSTSKVIISKDKIKYNKDISKDIKYIGPTTIIQTTSKEVTTTFIRKDVIIVGD